MKSFLIKAILFVIVGFAPIALQACDFEFKVLENQKEVYHKGDIVVVKVKVIYTHRKCPEGIEATKFNYKGLKVLGATKWKEVIPNTFERKFKLMVTDDSKKQLTFGAVRSCDKEGGAGSIKFKIQA